MFALTYKRFAYSKRMPLLTLGQLIIPLLCTLMAHLVYKDIHDEGLRNQPSLQLSLKSFKPGAKLVVPVASYQPSSRLLTAFTDQLDASTTALTVITNASAFEVPPVWTGRYSLTYLLVLVSAFTRGGLSRHHQLR